MMALPRSATKALGRWPWKHHDVLDTREGTDREGLKAGFAPEDKAESQPIEHEATPIVRTPSKLVKKRDAKPKDGETDEKGEPERPATPSPNSETAEHVIVPFEPVPRPPTPKHNVLVKKNSLSKRAAAKAAEPQDVPLPDGPDAVPEPLSTVASDSKEEKTADIPETPQHTVDPPGPIERETPAVPDTPAAPSHDHGLSSPSSSHVHPFPVRGVTPPNGTRFIEGTDGSLEPTESRTTGTTNHRPPRPPKPQRRISLRSFGFFYGKDYQSTGAFPAYVPPSERIVYEVRDEDDSVHRPAPTHKRTNSRLPIGLLSPRKPASPKVTKSDKRAVASALSLRTLIIGPAAMEPKNKAKKVDPKASAASALRKVNQQLLMPTEANRVIAALRDLPPPDLPPAAAQTVETVRKKKGWVFGRGGTRDEGDRQEALKGSTGTVAMPIHGCCLDITDEEAEEKHFSKLTGSGFAAPGSAVGTEPVANTASADLSSLVPMLKDLRLVNLQASPDLSSVNAASLNAQLNAPDLGFGQSADRDGPLAGSVPSAGSLVDGMEKVGQTLMSLGFATTAAVLPSHVGIHPPKDRMSVLTYWWGYEVVLPPPTMRYLGHVKSISGALLNFLTAFSLFSNGVREMLPFIRYIAQFIEFEWNAIKAQDKGRGVVCAATWVMPAALVPRPWDFVDPPMNDRMARTVTPGPASMHPATLAGLVPQASAADLTGPATEPGETSVDDAFNAEVRDEAPMVPLVRHVEEDERRQIETDNATTEIKDATTPVLKRSEDRDTQDT